MIDYQTYKMGDARDILVLGATGRLDNDTSEFFFDCVKGHIEDGNKKLVIDCRQLDYISSMGLGTLVRAHARMKKVGGNVKLAHIEGVLADALKTVGLNRLFHIYPSVTEACASFES